MAKKTIHIVAGRWNRFVAPLYHLFGRRISGNYCHKRTDLLTYVKPTTTTLFSLTKICPAQKLWRDKTKTPQSCCGNDYQSEEENGYGYWQQNCRLSHQTGKPQPNFDDAKSITKISNRLRQLSIGICQNRCTNKRILTHEEWSGYTESWFIEN